MNNTAGLSISLFLADRSWNGLVVADSASQNARVLTAPKSRLEDLIARNEMKGSGVYILTGPNSKDDFGLEGYVGESDKLAARLRSHAKQKSFWSRVYVAFSKDDWLSKSHILWLSNFFSVTCVGAIRSELVFKASGSGRFFCSSTPRRTRSTGPIPGAGKTLR
jgi:hypothetical protein